MTTYQKLFNSCRFMVCCDGCDNWFHGECVNITEEEAELLPEYYCYFCSSYSH
jgi:COMPASS component SPP1